MFGWRRSPGVPEALLFPSVAWFPIFQELLGEKYAEVPTAVHNRYSLEPGGPTLGEIAEDNGIW